MRRSVEPEWLDQLPNTDLRAQRSRSDLRRLNRCMGHMRITTQTLRPLKNHAAPPRLTELGAGDGSFLLGVARRLGTSWRGTCATLVDKQMLLTDRTTSAFSNVGWKVQARTCDVFDWATEANPGGSPVVLANLFLHHFESERLRLLLMALARNSSFFVALEPRRSFASLFFSKLVGFIGCNAVTRHDAPVSVQAGFRHNELSCLWPNHTGWILRERSAGPFSHLFVAHRADHTSGGLAP
ncbi:MAG TPA: hypothetical protein VFE51_24850 [Verrucomicrobiae bacterium]|nr:hypothetical protein [Verrucomicrobiae bacterium]